MGFGVVMGVRVVEVGVLGVNGVEGVGVGVGVGLGRGWGVLGIPLTV